MPLKKHHKLIKNHYSNIFVYKNLLSHVKLQVNTDEHNIFNLVAVRYVDSFAFLKKKILQNFLKKTHV